MGLFEGLSDVLAPHSAALNKTIADSANHLHTRLGNIESRVSDLGRPDIGDKWFRLQVLKEFLEESPTSLGHVPINEIWVLQSLVVDGIQNKSPAFVIEASGSLIASVIKEGVGSENFGGDAIFLPGEQITLTARKAGTIRASLCMIRQTVPGMPAQNQQGNIPSPERITPVNTHDPARDEIMAKLDTIYKEVPGETRGVGRADPGAVDPTSV